MNLPPINQIAGFGVQSMGQGGYGLPPINQVPGYSVPGQPGPNPGQQMNGFFIDPATGDGISVANAGEAVYRAPQGNPLYYGQTGAYTGPTGPTDGASPGLPPVEDVTKGAPPLTFMDALDLMMDPNERRMFEDVFGGFDGNTLSIIGLDMTQPYDPNNEQWKDALNRVQLFGDSTVGGGRA